MKYKFHGTSVSPLKFGGVTNMSYRIKIRKKDQRGIQTREMVLLSMKRDGPGIATIAVNELAASLGLLAPRQRVVVLFVNGINQGSYALYEYSSQEWFEREYQLTKYAVVKPYDDWDRKKISHVSDLDLFIENMEAKGDLTVAPIALASLEQLFEAIHRRDIEKIKQMVDLDYMARYLAFLFLVNNSHPIVGDNLRYVYDGSFGKFKLLFRLEGGGPIINYRPIQSVNNALFEFSDEAGARNTEIFKLLLRDQEFRKMRDLVLKNFTHGHRQQLLETVEKSLEKNWLVHLSSIGPTRPAAFDISRMRRDFVYNLNKAKEYIAYGKLYATVQNAPQSNVSDQRFTIINDSYNPMELTEINYFADGVEKTIRFDPPVLIPAPRLDERLEIIQQRHVVVAPVGGHIERLRFRSQLNNAQVPGRHVYINHRAEVTYYSDDQAWASLERNKIKWHLDEDTLVIEKGVFNIFENLVTPREIPTFITPGTEFRIAPEKSIVIRGALKAGDLSGERIKVKRLDSSRAFGVFAVIPTGNSETNIENFSIQGGSAAEIDGFVFLGQLSIHGGIVHLSQLTSTGSESDDGLNIRNAKVRISDSEFFDNVSDQVDLDFCDGEVIRSHFIYRNQRSDASWDLDGNGDGLDLSGSMVVISGSLFRGFLDKAISIGERSHVIVRENTIESSNIGMAVKDASHAELTASNTFRGNAVDVMLYTKKPHFGEPSIDVAPELESLEFEIKSGFMTTRMN